MEDSVMVLYNELREKGKEIAAYRGDATAAKRSIILAALEIFRCVDVARHEGLIMLEDSIYEMKTVFTCREHFKKMLTLVVDGTDPEQVKEICLERYFIRNLQAYEGLEYLMLMVGSLALQAGEYPLLIEEKICNMLPEDLEKTLRAALVHMHEKETEHDDIILAHVSNKSLQWDVTDRNYGLIMTLNYIFENMSDRGMQRALRDIDNDDFAEVMRVMTAKAKRKIFGNMSDRIAKAMAKKINNHCTGRDDTIECVAIDVLNIIIKLYNKGEVCEPQMTEFKERCNRLAYPDIVEVK